jgi:hypothetical protein
MPVPNKSPTIEGQNELYFQMCSVGKIWNPNQIAIVDYMAIRTLQQVTGKEQRRLKSALLHILRSANGIGAFMLTVHRTYHNSTSTTLGCYRSLTQLWVPRSDRHCSLLPGWRAEGHCCVMWWVSWDGVTKTVISIMLSAPSHRCSPVSDQLITYSLYWWTDIKHHDSITFALCQGLDENPSHIQDFGNGQPIIGVL